VHIASNADEELGEIREVAEQRGHETVLIDADQRVADAYGAQPTPQFLLIDPQGVLRYRGNAPLRLCPCALQAQAGLRIALQLHLGLGAADSAYGFPQRPRGRIHASPASPDHSPHCAHVPS
jgi:hypothetical protein